MSQPSAGSHPLSHSVIMHLRISAFVALSSRGRAVGRVRRRLPQRGRNEFDTPLDVLHAAH